PGGRSSPARIAVAFAASVLVLLAIPSVPSIAAGARTPPEVRVNQIGYDLHGPKRAYLMSSTALTGKTFAVVRTDGSVVYSPGIGASSGAWSDTYGSVYPLDFDAVDAPGTYRIVAPWPGNVRSPVFSVATGADLYRLALANALRFYQDERD